MKFKESYKYINPKNYIEKFTNTDWYLKLYPELNEYFYSYDGNRENKTQEWLDQRKEFAIMIMELLEADKIPLGKSGTNWDADRKAIDTIVIHHTSTSPDMSLKIINTLGLIRLYTPFYSKKEEPEYGQPIWSNHFYQNKPTFIAYHYIIEQDGTVYNILKDNQIGWQAGKWEMNCKSISVCFLDDLKNKFPTEKAIQSARDIIKQYENCQILGHKEINTKTTCPGGLFEGEDGWKKLLI